MKPFQKHIAAILKCLFLLLCMTAFCQNVKASQYYPYYSSQLKSPYTEIYQKMASNDWKKNPKLTISLSKKISISDSGRLEKFYTNISKTIDIFRYEQPSSYPMNNIQFSYQENNRAQVEKIYFSYTQVYSGVYTD